MGSATREGLREANDALAKFGGSVDLATGEELFAAALAIADSRQLLAAISDPAADPAAKSALVKAVFGRAYGPTTVSLLETIALSRWSSHSDVLVAVEELAIRAVASSAPSSLSIEAELFTFAAAASSNAELELALGSKLGSTEAKVSLVNRLIEGKASPQSLAIVRHLVSQPRGRRIGELLRYAAKVVADQAGQAVATVTSAAPIDSAQLDRLRVALSAKYGKSLNINHVVDPALIGGIRIQIGDDVIDGSISNRINELRLQLVG